MHDELFGDRRRAVEEEFFRRDDAALLAKRRSEDGRRAALAAASRITDDVLLDQLVAFGIKPETLAALSLVPLVEVAWADGRLEDTEKQAILAAATAAGLDELSPGRSLVEGCLSERRHPGLKEMWEKYIAAICATRPKHERDVLRAELLGQARGVAEAAGGFIRLGSRVSTEEQAVLDEIAAAFDGVEKILRHLELPVDPPTPAPARISALLPGFNPFDDRVSD